MGAPVQGAPLFDVLGMFDTGCTAAALIPVDAALLMRSRMVGSVLTKFANNQQAPLPVCRAFCKIQNVQKIANVIVAPQGSDVLFGMELLRLFGLKAVIDPAQNKAELSS